MYAQVNGSSAVKPSTSSSRRFVLLPGGRCFGTRSAEAALSMQHGPWRQALAGTSCLSRRQRLPFRTPSAQVTTEVQQPAGKTASGLHSLPAGTDEDLALSWTTYRGKVVVVGAGPAGTTTAMLLAKRGYDVQVYERRGDPALSNTSVNVLRTYPMGISERSFDPLRSAGATLGLMDPDTANLAGFWVNGRCTTPPPPVSMAELGLKLVLVDRLTLGKDLIAEARRLYDSTPASAEEDSNGHADAASNSSTVGSGDRNVRDAHQPYSKGRITFHFNQALASLDLASRIATFTTSTTPSSAPSPSQQPENASPSTTSAATGHSKSGTSTSSTTVQYDLIVGADGANSAVRTAMEAQVSDLSVDTPYSSTVKYKTFHGLPLKLGDWELAPELAETHKPGEYLYAMTPASADKRAFFGPLSMSLWLMRDGTLSGMLNSAPTHETEALRKLLREGYPSFPPEIIDLIVRQTDDASGQRSNTQSKVVRCSQFHGPRAVLVGDAAHAITANTGQGCNGALESAGIFAKLLDACNYDLDAAPAKFTAARKLDAMALQHTELTRVAALTPDAGLPKLFTLYSKALFVATVLVGKVLHTLMPRRFPLPNTHLSAIRGGSHVSYTRALVSTWVQLGMLVAAGAAAVAAAVFAVSKLVAMVSAMLIK